MAGAAARTGGTKVTLPHVYLRPREVSVVASLSLLTSDSCHFTFCFVPGDLQILFQIFLTILRSQNDCHPEGQRLDHAPEVTQLVGGRGGGSNSSGSGPRAAAPRPPQVGSHLCSGFDSVLRPPSGGPELAALLASMREVFAEEPRVSSTSHFRRWLC